ncbi:MAG: hypothetical protein ACE5JN_01600 [Candidatus Methylomirabilia bacterium]
MRRRSRRRNKAGVPKEPGLEQTRFVMSVAFLTAPSVPPAEAFPELTRLPPDRRPEVLVARTASVKTWLPILDTLADKRIALSQEEREARDPLVAVWLATPQENPEPLAVVADLLLLGGGWPLLRAVLAELEASRGSPRAERLERLARLSGVYVPSLYALRYAADGSVASVIPRPGVPWPRGLEGATPFDEGDEAPPPGHPAPEIQHLLGRISSPEEVAGQVQEGERIFLSFAVGLPAASAASIAQWVKKLRHCLVVRLRDERRLPPLSVGLTCFVPRPWTPLQWWPMPGGRALKDQLSSTLRALRAVPGVTVTHDLPKWAMLEGVLALGDRRAGDFLLATRRLGWDRACVEHPLNPAFFLNRRKRAEEILPWDHVDWGQDRARLRARYESALAAVGVEP